MVIMFCDNFDNFRWKSRDFRILIALETRINRINKFTMFTAIFIMYFMNAS